MTEADPEGIDGEALVALMPLAGQLGITVESASAERVVGSLAWAPELCTAGGILHGGTLMALADTAGALCAYLGLPTGASTATTTSTTHLIRSVSAGTVRATATPVHSGRSQIVVQTDLTDEQGRLVARTTQVQAVLRS
jgi:1,4-dihydroxy-2-naphthoyl-CoA hydrolase